MELQAAPRVELGKKVKNLRKNGFIPAVLYGAKVQAAPLSIPMLKFEQVYREAGESTVIKLKVAPSGAQKGGEFNVLIYDVTLDPLRNTPMHTDLYAVDMNKPIRTEVHLEFIGESPAVKNFAGILIKVHQALEVEALPKDLPHTLKIDLSTLKELEDKFLVKDIKLPGGVTIMAEDEEVLAIVEPPRTEAELEELDQAPVAEAVEVERVGEKEKEVEETEESGKSEKE